MRKFFVLYSKRANNLSIIILLYSTFLLYRFYTIQVSEAQQFKEIVNKKGWKTVTEYGERGRILDKNNKELAISTKKYDFWVNTNKEFDREKIAQVFSNTFNKEVDYYYKKLDKKSKYVNLEKNIPFLSSQFILEQKNEIKGLNVDVLEKRFYPYNDLAAQTLGYTDLKKNGICGIEGKFNNILSGDTVFVKMRKGPKGKYYKENVINELSNGYDIQLTIDIDIQKILQEELLKILDKTKSQSANGIIVNPNNGDIIAMATVPSFNPNSYYKFDVANYKNRVISDTYEPGSTFKLMTYAAAIDLDTVQEDEIFNCENGEYTLLNGKRLNDHEPHLDLTANDVFAHSSNIGISKISDRMNTISFYKYCKLFGFGTKTGIALNDEAAGNIREVKNWSKTSKTYISIGQELSITNLQLGMAYCSIANGGYLIKPNIIKKITDSNSTTIYESSLKPIRKVVNKNSTTIAKNALKDVVNYGTAKNLNLPGYSIGGKTGTAQKYIENSYSKNDFISSFASIYPLDKPKYVIIISFDSPTYGYHWANESAVPATSEILKRIIIKENKELEFDNYRIAYNDKNDSNAILEEIEYNEYYEDENHETYIVPNLKGKSLKEALIIAKSRGLKLDPRGISGKVIWQSLKPGIKFEKNETCIVKISV